MAGCKLCALRPEMQASVLPTTCLHCLNVLFWRPQSHNLGAYPVTSGAGLPGPATYSTGPDSGGSISLEPNEHGAAIQGFSLPCRKGSFMGWCLCSDSSVSSASGDWVEEGRASPSTRGTVPLCQSLPSNRINGPWAAAPVVKACRICLD